MEKLKNVTITEICWVSTVFSPKGRIANIYDRPSYGLSFCKEGQITYLHNKKAFVSDNSCVIILPKGQTYTLKGDKTGAFPLINFKCLEPLCSEFMIIPVQNTDMLFHDYEQIKELILFEKNRAKVMSIFYNMLYKLSNTTEECKILKPAIKYIENNYKNQNITNGLLANKCNISEVYLRKLFQKHFKTTPKKYISEIRLEKAKQLLTDGVFKINAISEECGYASVYSFCRLFKQKTGLTPSEYMKQNKIYKI